MWASLMGRTKKWLSRSHKWLRPIEHKPNSPPISRASEHVVARAHRATKILKAEETQTCLESNNHTMAAPAIEWILRVEKDGGGSELLQARTWSHQDQRLPNQAVPISFNRLLEQSSVVGCFHFHVHFAMNLPAFSFLVHLYLSTVWSQKPKL
ncbi:unnamed protein product [Malus baccata var. baccata]